MEARFNSLNRGFHDPLESFCANERVCRIADQYHEYITIMTETGRRHSLKRIREVYREHCEIISAIDSQNLFLIREAYLRHSVNAEKEMLWQLGNR